jgi:hypothetical protein
MATHPIQIHYPNGTIMSSTHTAEVDIPSLPPAARLVHIVPDLHNLSLLSIGQLCDADCDVQFNKHTVTVIYDSQIVLQGSGTPDTKLWHVSMKCPTDHALTSIGATTQAELVAFAHATLFSPTLSTLEGALARNFITNFPGLTLQSLRQHPPFSAATIKGI